jgi:hypothetical protein
MVRLRGLLFANSIKLIFMLDTWTGNKIISQCVEAYSSLINVNLYVYKRLPEGDTEYNRRVDCNLESEVADITPMNAVNNYPVDSEGGMVYNLAVICQRHTICGHC